MYALLALTGYISAAGVQDGLYLQEKLQFGKAESVFRALISGNPKDANNYYYLGNAFFQASVNYIGSDNPFFEKSNLDSAKKYFDKGNETDPNSPLLQVANAKILLAKGNATDAKAIFDKVLKVTKSKDVNVLLEIAEANIQFHKVGGDMDFAKDLLTKATAINPKSLKVFILSGDLSLAKEDGGGAVSSYENAEDIDKKAALPYVKTGNIYKGSNPKEALKDFQQAISIDSGYTPAHKELAEYYFRSRLYSKAVDEYRLFMNELSTDVTDIEREKFASYLFINGNYKEAADQLNLLHNAGQNDITLMRLKGWGYYETKDYAKSVQAMQSFFNAAPKDKIIVTDYLYYAKALSKTGQDSLSTLNLLKSLSIDSSDLTIYDTVAARYYKSGKYGEAAGIYARKVKRMGQSADYQLIFNEGYSYFKSGQYAAADSAFKRLTVTWPTITYGWLYWAKSTNAVDPKGEQGLAKPYYDKFIEIAAKDAAKNKDDLIEAYQYEATFYYNAKDYDNSKLNAQKLLDLDPENETAKQILQYVKQQQKGK